ncbi:MAG: hypothetical protein ACYC9S_13255, partial [Leptospirales bacterium]
KVKKELGYDNGGEDHRRFMQRLRDMKTANLVMFNQRTGKLTESSVLWSFSYDPEKGDRPVKPGVFTTSKRTALFEIRISKEYMELFADDLRIHCDPLIPDLIQIKDGMIASIVLFFLTMKDACRYKIRDVLTIIQGILPGMHKGTISRVIKKVKTDKNLEPFGITVEGDCLAYERNRKVFFSNPPKMRTAAISVKNSEQEPSLMESSTGMVFLVEVASESPEK